MRKHELENGGQLVSFQSRADSLGVKSDQSNRQRQSFVKRLLLEIVKSSATKKYLWAMWSKKYLQTKICVTL